MDDLLSRIQGSLYGIAVVDALGAPVEFKTRGKFPEVTRYRYNSSFDLPPGTWTDDTSMTLCLAQSIVDNDGAFIVQHQVEKYIRWYRHGYMSATGRCFDIGNATRHALSIWESALRDSEPSGTTRGQHLIDEELNKEESCGNGSLMRCAPVAWIYHEDPQVLKMNTMLASQPTHPHITCIEACQMYTHLIGHILNHSEIVVPKVDLFAEIGKYPFTSSILKWTFSKCASLETFIATPVTQISSSGFVVHTLEAALWAFFSTDSFRVGALKVVNLGDDADTVGAVYGGLAGAYYGLEDVPSSWITDLEARNIVDMVTQGVLSFECRKAAAARTYGE